MQIPDRAKDPLDSHVAVIRHPSPIVPRIYHEPAHATKRTAKTFILTPGRLIIHRTGAAVTRSIAAGGRDGIQDVWYFSPFENIA